MWGHEGPLLSRTIPGCNQMGLNCCWMDVRTRVIEVSGSCPISAVRARVPDLAFEKRVLGGSCPLACCL